MVNVWYLLNDCGSYVYHYTSSDLFIKKIYPNKTLKFSQFVAVNDPREAKEFEFGYWAEHNEFPVDVNDVGPRISNYIKLSHKIGCFVSDTPAATIASDNPFKYLPERGFARPRMWSQYASNHTGVCLIFKKDVLKLRLAAQFESFFEGSIKYEPDDHTLGTDNPFNLDVDKLLQLGEEAYFREHVLRHRLRIFFRKSEDWSQEREWRCVVQTRRNESEFFNFGDALTAIALGWKISDSDRNEIITLTENEPIDIAQMNWRNGFPQPTPLLIKQNIIQFRH